MILLMLILCVEVGTYRCRQINITADAINIFPIDHKSYFLNRRKLSKCFGNRIYHKLLLGSISYLTGFGTQINNAQPIRLQIYIQKPGTGRKYLG